MHRATRLMFATVGIGLLAAFLVLGLTGATAFTSAPGSPAHNAGSSLATASNHPAPAAMVHPYGNNANNTTTVWTNITSSPAAYSTLPAWVNFTIQVTVSNNTFVISPSNTNGTLYLVNEATETIQFSWAIPIVDGQGTYSMELNSTTLGCSTSDCISTLGNIAYNFYLNVYANATSSGGYPASALFPEFDSVAFITYTPTWAVVAPATSSVTTGNITVSVAYNAQYVTSVTLNIYSGVTLVFSQSFFQSNGLTVSHVWIEGTAGVYNTSVVVVTTYQTFYTNGTITVTPAGGSGGGGTVYQNTTTYVNKTSGNSPIGYFGLSPPASGTLFLLIGLIIGILVALVAARMMMSDSAAKPAQPWSDSKGDAANTCSVCGKSFGSADELAAHAKSEHGMQ
jgi:hypothetical protein